MIRSARDLIDIAIIILQKNSEEWTALANEIVNKSTLVLQFNGVTQSSSNPKQIQYNFYLIFPTDISSLYPGIFQYFRVLSKL